VASGLKEDRVSRIVVAHSPSLLGLSPRELAVLATKAPDRAPAPQLWPHKGSNGLSFVQGTPHPLARPFLPHATSKRHPLPRVYCPPVYHQADSDLIIPSCCGTYQRGGLGWREDDAERGNTAPSGRWPSRYGQCSRTTRRVLFTKAKVRVVS
jgi:hypothetical protein